MPLFICYADQERRIRDMLSIVEGSPSDTNEVKNPAKEKETSAPSVAKARYDMKVLEPD